MAAAIDHRQTMPIIRGQSPAPGQPAPPTGVESGMSRVQHIASRASRRMLLRHAIELAGPALAIGAGAALLAAIIDRLVGPGLEWWAILPASIALPLLAAGVIAWMRRGSRLASLSRVDEALRLEDRLGSAMSLADRADDSAFARLAVEEGERAAREVRVDRAIPLRFGNAWVAWGAMFLLAAGTLLLVRPMHLLRDDASHQATIDRVAQQERAGEELDDVAKALEELGTEANPALADTPGAQQALAELQKLREELARGETDADEARSEAAQSLDDLAQGLEESARESTQAQDAVREMFSKLPPKDAPEDPSQRLSEALRSGDLDQALDALDDLRSQADQLPPEQREQAARDLRALADDLEQLARSEQAGGQDADEQAPDPSSQTPDETGLSPAQRDELRDMGDAQQIEQALREQGFDEQPAQKLAEQLQREHREQQAREQAEQRARDLSDAARDAADEIQNPQPNTDGSQQQPQGQQPPNNTPEQGGSSADPDKQGDRQQPQNKPNAPGAPSPAPSPGQQQDQSGKPKPDPSQEGQQPSQGQPGQQQQGQQPGEQPGQQQGPQPGEQPGQQQGQQDGSQPGGQQGQGQQPQQQPGDQSGNRPGESSGDQPGQSGTPATPSDASQPGQGQSPDANNADPGNNANGPTDTGAPRDAGGGAGQGQDPGAPGSGVERLRQQIQDLRDQAQRAQKDQRQARELRERASELLDGMSDEERQRMLEWAQQMAQEQSAPLDEDFASAGRPPIGSETTPMDLRRPTQDGRVVGEFNDPNARQSAGDVSDRAPTPGEIREALRGLDQLVEDRAVPRSRQRVIERYFQKALERAEREQAAPAEAAPPPTPAKDADG